MAVAPAPAGRLPLDHNGAVTEGTTIEKKTSWVELYFDLIFVLAITQVSHLIANELGWKTVGIALGLFALLWWTWIGFALFCNRYGDERSIWQRLALIAATIPAALAAVAVEDMAHDNRTAFSLSLAGVRVLLTAVYVMHGGDLSRKIAAGYGISAIIIVVSSLVPGPWWWLLWIAAILVESRYGFAAGPSRVFSAGELKQMGKDWRSSLRLMKPTDPQYALNVPHLAERFGLFMIIVLGEVVVSAGQGALGNGGHHVSWSILAGVIAIAGGLWWIYFDVAGQNNERLLALAGGSPQMARSMFAFGTMIPAFALVVIAAGLKLLLEGHAEPAAYWLLSSGLGVYLLGVRSDLGTEIAAWWRLALFCLTFLLGFLGKVVTPEAFIWIILVWVTLCAIAISIGGREFRSKIGSTP